MTESETRQLSGPVVREVAHSHDKCEGTFGYIKTCDDCGENIYLWTCRKHLKFKQFLPFESWKNGRVAEPEWKFHGYNEGLCTRIHSFENLDSQSWDRFVNETKSIGQLSPANLAKLFDYINSPETIAESIEKRVLDLIRSKWTSAEIVETFEDKMLWSANLGQVILAGIDRTDRIVKVRVIKLDGIKEMLVECRHVFVLDPRAFRLGKVD